MNRSALALALMLLTTAAAAQQEPPGSRDLSSVSLEDLLQLPVVTGGRQSQRLSRAPATMLVISEQQIRERGYRDLKDVLRDLPGFDISENNAGEVRTLVMARGMLRNNKIMVLRNGRKLNSPSGELFVYGNNVPLAEVERIEVLYGPSSALYGADAFAGVVNLITRPVGEVGGARGLELEVAAGTHGTWDTSLQIAQRLSDSASLTLSARGFRSDGVDVLSDFAPEQVFREPAVYRGLYGTSWEQPIRDQVYSAEIAIGDVTLGLYRQDAKEPNGPATDVTQNGFSYVYDDSYVWHQVQDVVSLAHRLDRDELTLDSSVVYTSYELGRESGWLYSWGPQYKYASTTSFKLEEVATARIGGAMRVVAGLMLEKVRSFPKTNNLAARYAGDQLSDFVDYPDHPGLPDEYRGQRVYFGVFDYENAGVFGELTWELSPKLQVNIGGRYDDNSDYGSVATPRAGVVWSPDARTSVKLLYGQAYIAPSKYVAWEHWSAGGDFGFYPNPALEPERLRSVSVSAQRLLTSDLAVTVNLYDNRLSDLIETEGYPWIRNVNAGTAQTRGFETLVDYTTEAFSAFLYYSFLDAEDGGGRPIPKVADHKINAGFTVRTGRLVASPRVRWSSEIAKIPSPGYDESERIAGHTVVDITLRFERAWRGVDLFLTGVNVLDEKYFAAAPYGEGPDGWLMDKAPQPGRSLLAGAALRF